MHEDPQGSTGADAVALFERAPALRHAVHWLPLGRYPTPLEQLQVAGRRVLVKRDDLCAGGYAGNKVRKLEFLLGAARAAGARRLITAGATGSHHAFATAYHGGSSGFDVSLVLFPQRLSPHVREMLLLDAATGAELRWVRRMEAVPYGMWRAKRDHRRESPAVILPGGSSAAGALGYVSAGLELAGQLAAPGAVLPSSIHVAAGTLGTVAGMAIGLAWADVQLPVVATRITSRLVTNERALAGLVRATIEELRSAGADPPAPDAALRLIRLHHGEIGTGYGHETEAGNRASAAFAAAGLQLDPTYTAKAAAALLAEPPADHPPLFWHTLSAVHPQDLAGRVTPADLPQPFAAYLER
jgi:D-cysteine desulfhydrase